MAAEINIGDVVELRSGGPHMAVKRFWTNMEDQRQVDCQWFDSAGNLQEGTFTPAALKVVQMEQ